jgi:DNA-binding response OmpR family regulator
MKKKIVVVDDSELVLEMASDILEGAGYEVCTASNSIEANQYIFSVERPALIILDVMMPLLDGDKKLKILKNSEHTSNIPVIYLSSKPEAELQQLTVDTGADGYVCKPFSAAALLAVVRKFVPSC